MCSQLGSTYSHNQNSSVRRVLTLCVCPCLRFKEYLFEQDSALIHYAYVQDCLQRDETPRLTPFLLCDVLESLDLPVPEPTPAAVTGNSAAAVFDPEPPELFPVPSVVELYEQKEESEDEAETDTEGVVDL